MMSCRACSAALIIVSLLITIPASGKWLEFGAGCPKNSEPLTFHNITLDDLISFDMELQGLLRDVVKHDHAKYYRFNRSPGTVPMGEVGFPEVPVVTCFVIVPDGSDLDLTYAANCMETIGCLPVYPAPLDSLVEDSTSTPYIGEFFRKDSAAYISDEWYPSELAETTGEFMLRDQRVAIVNVYPVQYLASEDSLRVWSDIELSINFEGLDPVWNEDGLGYYDRLIGDRLLGYRPDYEPIDSHDPIVYRHTDFSSEPPIDPDYVIVVADGLDDAIPGFGTLQDFAEYRMNLNGLDVLIVNLNDIYYEYLTSEPWPTPDMIRDYMEDLWDWTTPGTRPTYLLLIGDHEDPSFTSWDPWFLPAYEFEYFSSTDLTANDSWYSYIHEDRDISVSVPDMIVGRLSARDVDELEDMLDLIQTFEEAEVSPYPEYLQYRRYLTRLSGRDDDYSYDRWNPSKAWAKDLSDWLGYTFNDYYCGDGDPNTSDDGSRLSSRQWIEACTDEFERGSQVIFYTDHGGVHYFECAMDLDLGSYAGRPDSTFDDLDVRDLSPVGNQDHAHPFVMLLSCSQNTFNWTSHQQYSAWPHWGYYNDDPEYPLYDFGVDCFAEELMKNTEGGAIGVFGGSWATAIAFYKQKENMLQALLSWGDTRIGDAMQSSRLASLDEYVMPGGVWRPDLGAYNLLGDPAVDIGDRMKFRDCCDLIISPEDLEVNRYPTMSIDAQGEMVFKVVVRNAGWLDAGSFDVTLEIEDDSHNQEILIAECDGLDAGEETTLKFVWDSHIWFDPPGTLFLSASAADPGHLTPDSWMPNNSARTQVYVADFYPNDGTWPCQTQWSSIVPPILCDFDGDPDDDLKIIVTFGTMIQAYRHDLPGEPVWQSDRCETHLTSGLGIVHPSIPVAGNVAGDDGVEIIVDGADALMIFDSSSEEPIYSYTHPGENGWSSIHTIALADFEDENGIEQRDEIVLVRGNELYVFDIVGNALVQIRTETLPNTTGAFLVSAWPVIADVNGIGSPEIVIAASWSIFSTPRISGCFVFDYDLEENFFEYTIWEESPWNPIHSIGDLPTEQTIALPRGFSTLTPLHNPAFLLEADDLSLIAECDPNSNTEYNSDYVNCSIMADCVAPWGQADRIIANAENQCFVWDKDGDHEENFPTNTKILLVLLPHRSPHLVILIMMELSTESLM